MRIGLGCTTIEPAITKGQIDGIGVYTAGLLQGLKQNQCSVQPYVYPSFIKKRVALQLSEAQYFKYSYKAYLLKSLLLPAAFSFYKEIESQIDIYHAPDHLMPRFKKIPTIATLHDGLMLSNPEWYTGWRSLKNRSHLTSMKKASHIITISNAMRKEIVEYWHIPEEKISVVYNGIASNWFLRFNETERLKTLKRLNISTSFLLMVGTLQPKKNVPRLIAAYLSLPRRLKERYTLIIVGKAGWNNKESLAAIAKLQESGYGRWLQYVNFDDLRVLFQAASLYLHPSLHEGFGLTLLQGFASNVPTLTSNVAAMPEVAGEAAYLVDPYSVEDIAQGIEKLLENPVLCAHYIKLGQARVQDFSWIKCAAETAQVYQQVLKK